MGETIVKSKQAVQREIRLLNKDKGMPRTVCGCHSDVHIHDGYFDLEEVNYRHRCLEENHNNGARNF